MKKLFMVLLCAVPVAFAGCRSAVGSVERANPIGMPQLVQDKRVMPDVTLRNKLEILGVNQGVASGDLTKVQVRVRNLNKRSLKVDYSWEWFDKNGMMVKSTSQDWKSLSLAGSEQKALSSIGPSPAAVDFVLKFQEPRPFLKRNKLNPFKP